MKYLLIILLFASCGQSKSSEALEKYRARTAEVQKEVRALESKLAYENKLAELK